MSPSILWKVFDVKSVHIILNSVQFCLKIAHFSVKILSLSAKTSFRWAVSVEAAQSQEVAPHTRSAAQQLVQVVSGQSTVRQKRQIGPFYKRALQCMLRSGDLVHKQSVHDRGFTLIRNASRSSGQ